MKRIILASIGVVIIIALASFTSVVSARSTKLPLTNKLPLTIVNVIKSKRILNKKPALLQRIEQHYLNLSWFPGYFFWLLIAPILELMKYAIENWGWGPGWIAQAFLFLLLFLVYAQTALLIMLGYIPSPV